MAEQGKERCGWVGDPWECADIIYGNNEQVRASGSNTLGLCLLNYVYNNNNIIYKLSIIHQGLIFFRRGGILSTIKSLKMINELFFFV
jgi:hypothetical protein